MSVMTLAQQARKAGLDCELNTKTWTPPNSSKAIPYVELVIHFEPPAKEEFAEDYVLQFTEWSKSINVSVIEDCCFGTWMGPDEGLPPISSTLVKKLKVFKADGFRADLDVWLKWANEQVEQRLAEETGYDDYCGHAYYKDYC